MNHTDWIQLLLNLATVLLSTFGAHYGAKNGASQDK